MSQMAMLTDVTRCIGCEECVQACKATNRTGEDRPWGWQGRIDDLSASRWTTVLRFPGGRFVRQHCRHCLEPACVSVCPVGALRKTKEGAVVYDSAICMGCRYCMMSCPFAIPRYLWSEPVPYVRKCIFCYDKLQAGELQQPACTAACPTGATIFGKREELLALARERIRGSPGRYLDRVYGESEVGGTSVLYISDVDLDALAWRPDLGTTPLPELTWRAQKMVPFVFAGVGALMFGTSWIIGRRMKRMSEAAPASPGQEAHPLPPAGVSGGGDGSPDREKP